MFNSSASFCNFIWLITCLPGWVAFRIGLHYPRRTQQRILNRILSENRDTEFLKKHPFEKLKPRSYDEVLPEIEKIMMGERNVLTGEMPFLLEPTGGSTAGTKLIPYTKTLRKEFQKAIDPWIADLFLKNPELLFGRHYWCITPSTVVEKESSVPVGFDSDEAYLGRLQQYVISRVFAVPAQVRECSDQSSAEYLTLLYLLKTPDLRLISIWHPSLLILMLQTLEQRFDELVKTLETGILPKDIQSPIPIESAPKRAGHLRNIGCTPSRIWGKLKVISCWGGEGSRSWLEQIKHIFPSSMVQEKGLVATEGITSIPMRNKNNIAAVRSHYYEFECEESGSLLPLWKLENGKQYLLVLTTGGGLYRYKTFDRIKVTGFMNKTPCLQFMTRAGITSDLFGEKVTLEQAEQVIAGLPVRTRFAMIAPEQTETGFRYALFMDAPADQKTASYVETQLAQNYHYQHARNIRQLGHAVVYEIEDGGKKLVQHLAGTGQNAGGIKLSALRKEIFWVQVLAEGREPMTFPQKTEPKSPCLSEPC